MTPRNELRIGYDQPAGPSHFDADFAERMERLREQHVRMVREGRRKPAWAARAYRRANDAAAAAAARVSPWVWLLAGFAASRILRAVGI